MVSLSAIAVGFLATAKAILFSIDQRQIVSQLRSLGHYDKLVDYLLAAIHWSFGLAVASALCFVVDLKQPASWHRYALAGWIFVLATSGFACYRVIHIFGKLLRSPDAPGQSPTATMPPARPSR
jgi:hypothetical protein